MAESGSKGSTGLGCGSVILISLQVVFIVLKCVGVLKWSWWKVLIPLWIDLGIAALFFIVFFVIAFIAARKRRNR